MQEASRQQREREQVPAHLEPEAVARVAREFTLAYHDLKEQTFATTTWMRVPLVKSAADMLVMQQIIAETRPELIVETGVYVGGGALFFASLQQLAGVDGKVVAVDIDLDAVDDRVRDHPRIELIEGSSLEPKVVERIHAAAEGRRVMVDLDSDHRAHHVLAELKTYSGLVSPGCYLIVEDGFLGGRPVRPDAVPGPSEALDAWLAEDPPFMIDRWQERFLLTQNPRGYLRRKGESGEWEPRPPRPERFLIASLERSPGAPSSPGSAPATAESDFERAAGEPDLEVEALRRQMSGGDGIAAQEPPPQEPASAGAESGSSVAKLLKELSIQQEVLRERSRLLAREQARLRRIEGSLPYRAYRRLRSMPGLRKLFELNDRRRGSRVKARVARRAHARRNRTQRFIDHHRGQ